MVFKTFLKKAKIVLKSINKLDCEIDPLVLKSIYSHRFVPGGGKSALQHINKFIGICNGIYAPNVDHDIFKVKLFPHSLLGLASIWFQSTLKGNLKSWFNMKASFLDRFSPIGVSSKAKKDLFVFKQRDDERLVDA